LSQKVLYHLGWMFVCLYARLMLRLDIHWQDQLPSGPKLFVANHPSATDPFFIHLIFRQPMSVMITSNAFDVPLLGLYLRKIEQICVAPGQGSVALEKARQTLQMGRSVTIFPEGHTSPLEGGFLPPRTGAARLALMTGMPLVPVGIYLPRERSVHITSGISGKRTTGHWYLRGPYSVTVGQPMQFRGDAEDRELVDTISLNIMRQIRLLARESEQRVRRIGLHGLPARTAT